MPPDAHPAEPPPASPHDVPEVLHHKAMPWLKPAGLVGLGLATAIVVTGVVTRGFATETLKSTAAVAAIPTVSVVLPGQDASGEGLTLPGQIEANDIAIIHPRVSGYLKRWYVDIGARVKAGQLLAEIDTPELDQQLAQARAAVATAVANQQLAKISADRWTRLLDRNAVSRQEADEKTSDLAAKTAVVEAARADLDRFLALQSFKRIVAPYEGVVTARNAHAGDLVAAGAPSDPGLFTVADDHRLRIYVHVPQRYSGAIKSGTQADLSVPEQPGRRFTAQISSTSEAMGAQSDALTAELQIDNTDHVLRPGDYAQVSFKTVAAGGSTLKLPSSALMFRQDGMAVGVVDATGHAHLRHISIARDLGASVELAAGVGPQDRVINNPPDSLEEGEQVRVAAAQRRG
jgi:RND family efflux transporter MFP subunit